MVAPSSGCYRQTLSRHFDGEATVSCCRLYDLLQQFDSPNDSARSHVAFCDRCAALEPHKASLPVVPVPPSLSLPKYWNDIAQNSTYLDWLQPWPSPLADKEVLPVRWGILPLTEVDVAVTKLRDLYTQRQHTRDESHSLITKILGYLGTCASCHWAGLLRDKHVHTTEYCKKHFWSYKGEASSLMLARSTTITPLWYKTAWQTFLVANDYHGVCCACQLPETAKFHDFVSHDKIDCKYGHGLHAWLTWVIREHKPTREHIRVLTSGAVDSSDDFDLFAFTHSYPEDPTLLNGPNLLLRHWYMKVLVPQNPTHFPPVESPELLATAWQIAVATFHDTKSIWANEHEQRMLRLKAQGEKFKTNK